MRSKTNDVSAASARTRAALAAAVLALSVAVGAPANASHSDGIYDQPVWFQWEKKVLDVLIIPADHGPIYNGDGVMAGNPAAEANPCTNSYTLAMTRSAQDWTVAISAFAPSWLKALKTNIYVIGCGATPPTSALTDPEILVAADENKATILGLSVSSRPCISLNSKMLIQSFTYNDMYTVAGHEFGHCMGLDHVSEEHPDADILDATVDENIGVASNPRHCPSNLNVSTLKGVFAATFGQPGAGVGGSVPVGSYSQIAC